MRSPNVLRVTTTHGGPLAMLNSDSEIVHTLPEFSLLQYIAQMLHTPYELVIASSGSGEYDLLRNGSADMIFKRMAFDELLNFSHFSAPYLSERVKFFIEETGYQPKFEAFTYPFSTGIWIFCLFVAIGAACISKWVTSSKTSFAGRFVEIVGSMLRQPLSIEIGSLKKIIWWASWLFWATIMSTSYSALFLSYMMVSVKQPTIKTFEELATAVHSKGYRCLATDIWKIFMSKSSDPQLRQLAEEVYVYDDRLTYIQHIDSTTAMIGDELYLSIQQLDPPNRVLVFSEDTLFTFHTIVMLSKNFCCRESFDLALLSAVSMGLPQMWSDKLLNPLVYWPHELRRLEMPEDKTSALGMADLKYVFFVYLIGISLSVVVFLCEILIPKRIAKKLRLKNR